MIRLHYDQVGTLRVVTDKNKNIVKEIIYDTYGNIFSETNPSFTVAFGFGGGDSNLYGYVLGDPVGFVDPTGLIDPRLAGAGVPAAMGGAEPLPTVFDKNVKKIVDGVCRDVPKALKNAHNSLSNLENNINKTKNPISRELGKMLFNKTQVNSSQILNADSMYTIIQGAQQ